MKKKHLLLINFLLIPLLAWTCSEQPASSHIISDGVQNTYSISPTKYSIPTGTIYEKEDSITIEKLLQEVKKLPPKENRMFFFGKCFIGKPYVAHTLEKGQKEVLVVNTRELDCTTFIESCAALTICDQKDIRDFAGYCNILCQLRYKDGIINGYPSRLHYFTQWIADNEQKGFIHEITHEGAPFTAIQNQDIHYMSAHPENYSKLKGHQQDIKAIKEQEQLFRGIKVRYIPKNLLNQNAEQLSDIQTGDILALITSKDGLDTSHLGMAVWQKGKLHLLNASQIHKAVWIDPTTLYNYSKGRKSNLGIRVVRVVQ